MNEALDYFRKLNFSPETLFSADNSLLQNAGRAHRGLFEALESTARANLSLASDLLDLNHKSVEALYAGKPLADQLQTQADLTLESTQRVVAWTDELRDAATEYRVKLADLANEAVEPAEPAKKAGRTTAKAA